MLQQNFVFYPWNVMKSKNSCHFLKVSWPQLMKWELRKIIKLPPPPSHLFQSCTIFWKNFRDSWILMPFQKARPMSLNHVSHLSGNLELWIYETFLVQFFLFSTFSRWYIGSFLNQKYLRNCVTDVKVKFSIMVHGNTIKKRWKFPNDFPCF